MTLGYQTAPKRTFLGDPGSFTLPGIGNWSSGLSEVPAQLKARGKHLGAREIPVTVYAVFGNGIRAIPRQGVKVKGGGKGVAAESHLCSARRARPHVKRRRVVGRVVLIGPKGEAEATGRKQFQAVGKRPSFFHAQVRVDGPPGLLRGAVIDRELLDVSDPDLRADA